MHAGQGARYCLTHVALQDLASVLENHQAFVHTYSEVICGRRRILRVPEFTKLAHLAFPKADTADWQKRVQTTTFTPRSLLARGEC